MSPARKQLPAFARTIVAMRRRGLSPSGLVVAADWNFARSARFRCVVPPGVDPLSLDFGFTAGLEVLLIAHDQDRLDVMAQAVLPFKPQRLIGCARAPHARITPYLVP